MEPFSSSEISHSWTRAARVSLFFYCSFPPFDISKVLNITANLTVSGETIKDKQTILNKTSSLVLGFHTYQHHKDYKQQNKQSKLSSTWCTGVPR